MAISDVYEMSVDMDYSGQQCVNVHHFLQSSADGTGTALEALDQIWQIDMLSVFLDCMVADVTLLQTRIRRILPTQTQAQTFIINASGGFLVDGLPPQVCAMVRQRAFPSGRKGTGGVKIVGVPVNGIANGRTTVAYAAVLQIYADAMEPTLVDASGYEFDYAVHSFVDGVTRSVEKCRALPRVRTVYSRSRGVGQ